MKTILASVFIALATAFAPPALAQRVPEVKDGSFYGSGKDVVKIEVTETSGGLRITAVDASGSSSAVGGIRGPSSTPQSPTATGSAIMTTRGGEQYMIDGGEVKKRNDAGKWVKQKKTRGPKKNNRNSPAPVGNINGSIANPADDVVGLPG